MPAAPTTAATLTPLAMHTTLVVLGTTTAPVPLSARNNLHTVRAAKDMAVRRPPFMGGPTVLGGLRKRAA